MRIAFDAKRAYKNTSGLGTYSRGVIQSLAENHPQDDFFLFTKEENASVKLMSNQRVIIPSRGIDRILPSLWRSYWMSGQIHKSKIHVFHGLSNELPLGINKAIKTVVTIHDLLFLKSPQWYSGIDRAIYQNKVRYAIQRADKIIAVSKQTKEDILKYYPTTIEEKIAVIPPPIRREFSLFKETQKAKLIRDKFNLPKQFIISLGTVEKRKNLETLVDALFNSDLEIPLLIIGKKTDYWKSIESKLQKYKGGYLAPSFVSDEELPYLLSAADLLVNLSIDEGFGMQNIEAMMSGTPVLLSNNKVFKDTAGEAAIYVDHQSINEIASSIKYFWENKEKQTQLIEAGLNHSEQYSSEKVSESIYNIYKAL